MNTVYRLSVEATNNTDYSQEVHLGTFKHWSKAFKRIKGSYPDAKLVMEIQGMHKYKAKAGEFEFIIYIYEEEVII